MQRVHRDYDDKLKRLQETALELIRVAELERSGVRDGDGTWHGSDPLDAVLQQVEQIGTEVRDATE